MRTSLTPYGNGNGNSGIIGYEIGDDSIDVEFANGGVYTYSETNIGRLNFLNMQVLAMQGSGLNAFINKHVRGKYTSRTPEVVTAPVKDVTLTITTTASEAVAIVTELLNKFDVDFKLS